MGIFQSKILFLPLLEEAIIKALIFDYLLDFSAETGESASFAAVAPIKIIINPGPNQSVGPRAPELLQA